MSIGGNFPTLTQMPGQGKWKEIFEMKFLSQILVTVFLIGLQNCGGSAQGPNSQPNSPSNPPASVSPDAVPFSGPLGFFFTPSLDPGALKGHQPIVNAIEAAQSSIYMTIYHLTPTLMWSTLWRTQRRLILMLKSFSTRLSSATFGQYEFSNLQSIPG